MAPRPDQGDELLETKFFIPNSESDKSGKDDADEEGVEIVDAIGIWGKYQLQRSSLILVVIWLPASFHLLDMVFYRAETDYWCQRPTQFENVSIDAWKNLTNPGWTEEKDPSNKFCRMKNYDYSKISVSPNGEIDLTQHIELVGDEEYISCSSWEYDTTFWEKTIIMDFDLVCERYDLRKLQQQVTFLGVMSGVFISGLISDRFGRRKTMLVLLLVCVFIGSATALAPNLPLFLVGIFICGFSSMGYGTVMYVWMMEHVGGKYKTILGAAPHYNFGFWGLMTAVIAYLVPNWRHMHLIFTLPLILLLPMYWYLPESSRWLLAKGRKSEAEDIIRHIAQVNGRELPKSFHLALPVQHTDKTGGSYIQIFQWPNLRKKALICYWLWFSTGLIYYGLTLNSNTLGTELFTTFSIGKLLEFPTITLVIFLLLKSGRRITLIMFYCCSGLSLVLTYFVPVGQYPYEWPLMVLNILGRISSISTLAVNYVYAAEIFPTVVRTAGLGSSSFWARVGPMIAPFIVELKIYGEAIPLVVFGIVALCSAFLVTFMPETSKTPLPDTIEDGEHIGSGDSLWNKCRSSNTEKC